MNYAYLRVSTQEQNLKNQELEIKRHYHIDKWYYDKKSGTLDYHKRNLNSIINEMQKDDILIVTELSRLGRSIIMIFQIVTEIQSKDCGIIAIKNNFNISPSSKNDIVSQTMLFAFGLSAQIERELISERTKQGLTVARLNGKKIGRQKGVSVYYVKLRKYQKELLQKRKQGASINALAKEYNVNWVTMKNFFEKYAKMKKPKSLTDEPKKHGHPTYQEIEWFEKHK